MVSILSPGQRRLHGVLVVSAAVLLATSLYLWLRVPAAGTFPRPFQAVLLVHLALGLLVLVPGTAFVLWHLPRALARRNRIAVASGTLLALLGLGLAVTGIALAAGGSADRAFWSLVLHRAGAAVLPLLYLLHRREGADAPGPRRVLLAALAVLAATAGLVGLEVAGSTEKPAPAASPPASPGDPFVPWGRPPGAPLASDAFAPSSVLTRSGKAVPDAALLGQVPKAAQVLDGKPVSPGAEACVRCHPDVVAQWESSAHRQSSFANPFYAVAVEALRNDPDQGLLRSQWCAGCHDPAVLLTGRWTQPVERSETHARAGLTCLACHGVEAVRDVGGNGGYVLRDDSTDPYLGGEAEPGSLAGLVHDGLVKSNPAVHKRQMLVPELFRTGEYCSACHKVSLDAPVNRYRWLRGQDEYDSWHASGANHASSQTFYLPPQRKVCQDCHMPPEAATRGDVSAKGGMVRSHRFAAANLALAQLTQDSRQRTADEGMLQSACRVDVFALVKPDGAAVAPLGSGALALGAGEVELDVVVRNKGTGHAFPGGTIDSNDVWLEVTAKDQAGKVVLSSGALDDKGERDPRSHAYRALFLDKTGEPIARRNPQDIRATVVARTIGPSRSDVARYRLVVPEGTTKLDVRARLRYRKLDPAYARYSLGGEPAAPMLVCDCASDSKTIALDGGESDLTTSSTTKVPLWERWNDYGVGLLDQGDTRGAVRAFGEAARLAPERPDGPRNQARAALRDGAVDRALAFLDEAEKRAPGDPQNAFFWGQAREREGRLEDAARAYARVLERFPLDREARRGLAEARLKSATKPEDYRAALADFLALLKVDPEDRGAHYRRIAIYRALGDEASAAAAEQAYKRFQLDEDAKATAPVEAFARAHADANLEAQPVHVH